jgi:hypothetical protein
MQIDNIRIDPWIPTVRLTTLMLMLACSGIGFLVGRLTTEKIVVTQQDRPTTAAGPVDPAASSSSAEEGGRASREPENRPSRASNAREEASDTATPPAALLTPGTANEYQVRHKREPRPARMIRGWQLDRPSPDESGERVEGRHPARDYRDLRNQMLSR